MKIQIDLAILEAVISYAFSRGQGPTFFPSLLQGFTDDIHEREAGKVFRIALKSLQVLEHEVARPAAHIGNQMPGLWF